MNFRNFSGIDIEPPHSIEVICADSINDLNVNIQLKLNVSPVYAPNIFVIEVIQREESQFDVSAEKVIDVTFVNFLPFIFHEAILFPRKYLFPRKFFDFLPNFFSSLFACFFVLNF